MNNFSWHEIVHSDGNTTVSLLEQTGISEVRFWASIKKEPNEDNKYEFCAFSKDRVLQTVPKEQYVNTIEEAEEAIIDYLKDQGVLDGTGTY